MLDTGLKGKVVLVTGANHGIGAAAAKAFAAQGACVYVHYLRLRSENHSESPGDQPGAARYAAERAADAREVVLAIRQSGGQVAAGEADLSDPVSIPRLFDQVEIAFGPVEVLVNNAADWQADTFIPGGEDAVNRIPEQWSGQASSVITAWTHDRHFMVNSRASALMMAEFLRRHVKRNASWGRIINLSTSGSHCFPGEVSYGASKAALESLSRSAATEMGPFGITVNIVSPGPVQTGWITPDLETQLAGQTPLRRIGMPDDIADVILFLASDQARWVTGQLLHVGGGHTM